VWCACLLQSCSQSVAAGALRPCKVLSGALQYSGRPRVLLHVPWHSPSCTECHRIQSTPESWVGIIPGARGSNLWDLIDMLWVVDYWGRDKQALQECLLFCCCSVLLRGPA